MCSGPEGEEGLCSGPEGEEGLCAQDLKVSRGCVLRA